MRTIPLLATIALTLVACGGEEESASGSEAGGAPSEPAEEITVSAAASLTTAFEAYDERTPVTERFSFAGSDALAAQIRQGATPDVYAAANTELPQALFEEGEVGEPTVFVTNTLVIAVPTDSQIASIDDLTESDVDLVIGTEDVPFGSYTRTVLDRLPAGERDAILANVRSEEPDVNSTVGKLTQGAGDASFTYSSDVAAASGRLRDIELPAELQPDVAYAVAVVEGAENPKAAQAFIDGLVSGAGAQVLQEAGFRPPPAG